MYIILSVIVVAGLVFLAALLGRRILGPDHSSRPVIIGILSGVGLAGAFYPISAMIKLDDFSFAPLIVLGVWVGVPAVAAGVAWVLAAPGVKTESLRSALWPTLGLVLILNPVTEIYLACTFGRSIYATQLLGFGGC